MHPSSANVVGLYDRHAAAWAMDRGHALIERRWLEMFVALLPANAAVLDIGCGAGDPIGGFLLSAGCRLTGVDSSPAMIAMCQRRHPRSTWRVGDMRRLSLDQRFDGLIAWDSFFHLTPDDQTSMFPIFATHSRSGATLMFTSGPAKGEAIGSFRGEDLYHASLSPEAYTALLRSAGFRVVAHKAEDPACGGRTIWLAQRDA